MAASEPVLRRLLVEIGRRLADKGLIVAAEGNLSVRLGGHAFLVTPAGVSKGALLPRDLLVVDLAGRCAAGRPTSEWPLHRALYAARPDAGAVCHAHPPWATAFSVAGRDLDGSLLTETQAQLPRVPLAARAEPGTEEVPAAVVPWIRDHDAVLLGSHGVVTVGPDLETAFARLETVERLAQVTLLAELAAGGRALDGAALQDLLRGGGQPPAR
ncbi:MAG: class II aldolase/adducin family protein [Candidatus Krumholzibacteriia bacterium]